MRNIAIISSVLSLVILAIAVWQFDRNRKLSEKVRLLQSDFSTIKLRAMADDLFIEGQTDDALALYRQYDSLANDSLEIMRYSRQIKTGSTFQDSLKLARMQRQLERATTMLRQFENMESPTTEIVLVETETDKSLELQIQILEHNLMTANQEIEKLKKGKGVIQFPTSKNGSVTYLGDLRNGMANGRGFGYWKSGSSYDGQWKDNMRHGEGVFIWADGEKYEGEYQNDQRHGYGVYMAKAGRYEGQWKEDMRHGEGKLYEANGKFKLQGIWEKDKLVTTVK
jgi:hypothetical protein